MKDFLIREGCGVQLVDHYEEDELWDTCYDGTCDYVDYSLDIYFIDLDGAMQSYFYEGSLSDLVRELTKPEPIPKAAPWYVEVRND